MANAKPFDADQWLDHKRLRPDEEKALLLSLMGRVTPEETVKPPGLIMALDTLAEAEELLARKGQIVGLTTGYPSLDLMTKGMAPGDLCIFFGDTSHGKSQLTQNITYNLAKMGVPVMFIGLEMTNAQNTTRFMGIGAADAEEDRNMALASIMYPANNDLKYENLQACIKEAVEAGAQMVVIDQLQQLTRSVTNTASETSLITHEVKRLAVGNNIPIILISHINRGGDKDAAPTLKDLKGSSSIEQDADMCIAVWRDMDPRNERMHLLDVWLRKNRNRGMEHYMTQLEVKDGVRLVETGFSQ